MSIDTDMVDLSSAGEAIEVQMLRSQAFRHELEVAADHLRGGTGDRYERAARLLEAFAGLESDPKEWES